jgi:hypothetical protein
MAKPETSDFGTAGLRGKEGGRVTLELLNGYMMKRWNIVNIHN